MDQTTAISIILGAPLTIAAIVRLSKPGLEYFNERSLEVSFCPEPGVEFLLSSDVSARSFGSGTLVNTNHRLLERITSAEYRIVGRRFHVRRRTLSVVPAKVQIFDDSLNTWTDSDHVAIPRLSRQMEFRIEGCSRFTYPEYFHLHGIEIWLEIVFYRTGKSARTVYKSKLLSIDEMTERRQVE